MSTPKYFQYICSRHKRREAARWQLDRLVKEYCKRNPAFKPDPNSVEFIPCQRDHVMVRIYAK